MHVTEAYSNKQLHVGEKILTQTAAETWSAPFFFFYTWAHSVMWTGYIQDTNCSSQNDGVLFKF